MHCNSIQGMAHETLTLGCLAQEAAYSSIMWDRVPDDEREAMTHHLHSEADVAWKEMHEVMYNHQLHYHIRCLPGSCASSAQPTPAGSHRHFVPHANTPHHRLLPRIFHLQKVAPRAGWCFTSPQENQGIPHSVQSLRWSYPPTK